MKIDYEARLTAVRQQLEQWEVDALLITSPINRRWLSGFTGSNAQLLISAEHALLATDFRYFIRAEMESPTFELFKHQRQPKYDRALFKAVGAKRIGIEKKHVTLEQAAKWRSLRTGIKWVPLPQTVEPFRAIKSSIETELMRRAAAITDQAMSQLPEFVKPGMSEKQVAWELEKTMRDLGADEMAFPIIVASGPNSALPHHTPSTRPLQIGDPIIIDMGAKLDGYHSDLTRTFFLGNEPSDKFWHIYNLVHEANKNVFAQTKAGMRLQAVDALARDVIASNGYANEFGHGLGHGVGLEIHEDPFLSPRAEDGEIVEVGMNVTVEPGIYIPGWGGVRLEDFAVLTEQGLDPISHSPKQPIIPV